MVFVFDRKIVHKVFIIILNDVLRISMSESMSGKCHPCHDLFSDVKVISLALKSQSYYFYHFNLSLQASFQFHFVKSRLMSEPCSQLLLSMMLARINNFVGKYIVLLVFRAISCLDMYVFSCKLFPEQETLKQMVRHISSLR